MQQNRSPVALTLLALVAACWVGAAESATPARFIVTHAMTYNKGGVDLTPFGVLKTPVIYESSLLPSRTSDNLRSEPALQAFAANLKPGPLPTVIDIERWSIYTTNEAVRAESLRKFLLAVDSLRKARPDLKFGYYGVVPERVYFPLVRPKKPESTRDAKAEWEAFNQRANTDFVPHVDAIFPSLYTFYEDQKGWETYARETLRAARQFKKPVYVFLWPQFHSKTEKLKGKYLPGDYWRMELEVCRELADGIIIWNHEREQPWDPEAPWWKETVAFLERLKRETSKENP
jgi:hypothetical protein